VALVGRCAVPGVLEVGWRCNVNAREILEDVLTHPGTNAKEVAERLYDVGTTRTAERNYTNATLRLLSDLGLLRRVVAEPRHSNEAPYHRYMPGPMVLASQEVPR